jgi:hypothetical protein
MTVWPLRGRKALEEAEGGNAIGVESDIAVMRGGDVNGLV